jgi:hypothetical protein
MKDSVLNEFFDELEVISTSKLCYFEDDDISAFKPVKGIPGYEIYEDGRVWSNKRGQFLTPNVSGTNRYPKIKLYANGKQKTFPLHKLVAETFIPTKLKHPAFDTREWEALPLKARQVIQSEFQVDHRDGNPENYHLSNLRWCTSQENRDYYYTEQRYL